jgi:hypothetical protein
MNLVGNNKHDGVYLAVAASSNQLPQHVAFNESAKLPISLSNRDAIGMTAANGHDFTLLGGDPEHKARQG